MCSRECVAVCCGMLRCDAVCDSVSQCVALCCVGWSGRICSGDCVAVCCRIVTSVFLR